MKGVDREGKLEIVIRSHARELSAGTNGFRGQLTAIKLVWGKEGCTALSTMKYNKMLQ